MNKLIFAALLVGAAACGGNVVVDASGGAGASTGTGAGVGTGAGTTTTVTTVTTTTVTTQSGPCPASAPGNQACPGVPEGFRCTYGDSVRPDCRAAWSCLGGQWLTQNGTCSMTPAMDCSSTQPGPGDTCKNEGDVCVYGDTICDCSCGGVACMPPIPWQCAAPPTTPGCPALAPNDGTACSTPGVQCTYGDLCAQTGALMTCANGFWRWNTMIACGG